MTLLATDIDFLRKSIGERSGNVISNNQSYLLEARLKPVAKSAGLTDVASLVAELKKNSRNPLHDKVSEAMTINETSFFSGHAAVRRTPRRRDTGHAEKTRIVEVTVHLVCRVIQWTGSLQYRHADSHTLPTAVQLESESGRNRPVG